MSDPNKVRINELARELEIKAKALIESLPDLGFTEKVTHSSSISVEVAEKARKHFLGMAEAEVAAESAKVEAEKAAKAAKLRPPAPPPAAVAAKTAPAAGPTTPPLKPGSIIPPAAVPVKTVVPPPAPSAAVVSKTIPGLPAMPKPTAGSTATATAAVAPAIAKPTGTRPTAPPPPALKPVPGRPIVTRHAAPTAGARTGTPGPRIGAPPPLPPGARPRPGAPPPLPPGSRPRPNAPPFDSSRRPGANASARPAFPARPGMAPRLDKLPPKTEPGKPIYQRKPAPRGRPQVDKRFEEGERKLHPVRQRPGFGDRRHAAVVAAPVVVEREPRLVTITEGISVRELADKLDVRSKELLKNLLDKGVFASINQALDVQTATTLAEAFNGIVEVISFEEEVMQETVKEDKVEDLVPRAPVVTVMGHVDHGKTSLLDALRETEVAAGEAGGITQHIGASQVIADGRRVVFIDTPGHEAFTRMRARGAKVTDLVVLVVAADDGVMPQTKEAIDHAKAAKVPIIVAMNKIDKPEAQPERVKRQLGDNGLMPEEWGGDTVVVPVSAKLKQNLDKLVEMILLTADIRELKANPKAPATGTVLESRVDRGRGPVATVLVQNGTLRNGDVFICGSVYGKVRAMFDDHARPVREAGPATPVEVLGLQGVPAAGDQFQVADEAKARHIVDYRQTKQREATLAKTAGARITLNQLHEQLKAGEVKELPVVIKADVQGSVEVLSEMLPKLSNDQVRLKIIHASVGAVAETDVLLASASNAIVIAFNVRPERKAADLAQQENVDIRLHSIIYEVSDEIQKAMTGLLSPVFKETYMGRANVRETFRIKGVGIIAGCNVGDGVIKRDSEVRVLRDSVVIYTGRLSSLKRFKDDASEVRTGFDCGIGVANFNDVKIGDVLECFVVQKMAATASGAGTPVTAKA